MTLMQVLGMAASPPKSRCSLPSQRLLSKISAHTGRNYRLLPQIHFYNTYKYPKQVAAVLQLDKKHGNNLHTRGAHRWRRCSVSSRGLTTLRPGTGM